MSRSEQREDTRRRLLVAAREAFEADGFEETHLRDIARAAGVAAGTVFVHFADKRDLLHAALFEDLEAAMGAALGGGPDGLEAWLDHVVSALLVHYARRPNLSRVLLRESILAEPPWAGRFIDQLSRVHVCVVARYELARDRGEVGGDAVLFGVAFLAFYQFALLAWTQQAHPDPRSLVRRLVAAHLAGSTPRREP